MLIFQKFMFSKIFLKTLKLFANFFFFLGRKQDDGLRQVSKVLFPKLFLPHRLRNEF